jgi:hypothetical protein
MGPVYAFGGPCDTLEPGIVTSLVMEGRTMKKTILDIVGLVV